MKSSLTNENLDNLPQSVLFSTREVADWVGVPLSMVRRWLRSGKLSGKKIRGRWYFDPIRVRETLKHEFWHLMTYKEFMEYIDEKMPQWLADLGLSTSEDSEKKEGSRKM